MTGLIVFDTNTSGEFCKSEEMSSGRQKGNFDDTTEATNPLFLDMMSDHHFQFALTTRGGWRMDEKVGHQLICL